MALRKYEIQKMKYFFAVVYWDSAHTANLLYNEIDGLEFELSNLRMDLRFIPDSLTEFPYPPKEVWYEVPDEYECNFFVNRAIGHTKVKLTWDQDDPKQIKIVKKKFNDDQIEQQDLRDYLASSGGEESDDPEEVNRKRALLGLNNDSESDEDINNAIGAGKSKNKPYSNQTAKGDIKITFKSGFEDIGKNLIEAKKEKDEMKDESAFNKFQRERKQKKREKKLKDKEKKEQDKEMMYEKPEEPNKNKHKKVKLQDIVSKDAATKEELKLLVEDDLEADEFKANPADSRFKAIYEKGVFSIDPTHSKANKNIKTFVKESHKRKFKKL